MFGRIHLYHSAAHRGLACVFSTLYEKLRYLDSAEDGATRCKQVFTESNGRHFSSTATPLARAVHWPGLVNTEIEFREFSDLLVKRREELRARSHHLQELRELPDQDRYGYDAGDLAVQEDDKNRIARQIEVERAELRAVNAALARITEGTYGQCLACGEFIQAGRLRAIPSAQLCTGCAEIQELMRRESLYPSL